MTIASLAMYPFPTLQSAYDRLWQAVRRRLSFDAPDLDWDVPAIDACRREDLLLGQTCGWPLVTELAGSVQVVGTFDSDVEGCVDGTYQSVLISSHRASLDDLVHRADLTVAANSADSLSGWISLRAVAAEAGVSFGRVLWTGSHAASVEAIAAGRADLASIDAVTWAHLAEQSPVVVGHGMRVPSLPLVTSASTPQATVAELRSALARAIDDPAMAATREALRIRRFISRDFGDYERLADLAPLG